MNILVVDDEPTYRLLLMSALNQEGWYVAGAENGLDAMAKLERQPFDIVITDVYMPVMDGVKFHSKVRSKPEFQRLPFLFVSGYDDEHTMSAVKDPTLEKFLKKGRPVRLLKAWIDYLTTPVDQRPDNPPS